MDAPQMPAESRILVVDDTLAIHEDFRKILGAANTSSPALLAAHAKLFGAAPESKPDIRFRVDCVAQGADALENVRRALIEEQPYSVAFIDMRMPPGWDGIETTRHLWDADPRLQVVICTAYSDHSWGDMVAELGETDNLLILKKPFDNIEVLQLAHALSVKWTMTQQARERIAVLGERVREQSLELRRAEGRFTEVFHANPVPTTLQTLTDGRYIDVNPAFLALAGWDASGVLRHTSHELGLWPDGDVWSEIIQSFSEGRPLRSHPTRLRNAAGDIREVLLWVERVRTGPDTCVLTSIEDVTERVLLQRKYQHAQKMEAVGQLAAGVAHDFNNLLTVIQSYTDLVLNDTQLSAINRDGLSQVQAAAARAAALTRQLLVFSRRQIAQPKPIRLSAMLSEMKEMLRRLIPEHISIEWHCADNLPPILADEANLEQVIMNLFVNARDAITHGGKIAFHATPEAIDEVGARRHPDAREGAFVRLTVKDTGHGMTPEVMSHIFEPFFTTKEVGRGTGLGLSTVYAIVRQHSGWVEVSSTLGTGSEFNVYLPALQPRAENIDIDDEDPFADKTLHGKGERILVVEDEPSVRFAVREIAQRAGYHVTDAIDAPEALDIWRCHDAFDLLLTDVVMPRGISGIELATQLRTTRPDLKVVISTGYSRDLLEQKGQLIPGAELLLKPFTGAELLKAVRSALDTTV